MSVCILPEQVRQSLFALLREEESPNTQPFFRAKIAGNSRPSQGEGCEQRRTFLQEKVVPSGIVPGVISGVKRLNPYPGAKANMPSFNAGRVAC